MAIPRRKLRGPSALACLGKTKREACLGKTWWEAVTRGQAEGVSLGRRSEGSEGCLANARQDKKWGLGKTKEGVARQDKKWELGVEIVKNLKSEYNVG